MHYTCYSTHFCAPLDFFDLTDILCVNETEAMIFAGHEKALDCNNVKEIENLFKTLLQKCPTVIITLGDKGAAYATKDNPSVFDMIEAPQIHKGLYKNNMTVFQLFAVYLD